MESKILKELFSRFDQSNLQYCVLRNYQELPESLGGSDLDLAVLPKDLSIVADVLIKVADDFGGSVIMDYTSSGRMIRILGCYDYEWWGMAVDLFSKMEYRGVEYISTKSIIDRSIDYKGVMVSPDYDAAITALVKELLSNGVTRKNYLPDAKAAYNKYGDESLYLLKDNFELNVVNDFKEFLLGKEISLRSLVKKLRGSVLGGDRLLKLPMRIRNFFSRYNRVFNPIGSSIAVLGTDGAGKTTIINLVTPILEQALHSKIQYEHLRPNWLPALGAVVGNKESGNSGIVTNPHAQQPSGFLGSMARLVYYKIDYIVGYWGRIFPRLVKRPHICLFDRYYYDILLDPRRMRIALPQWIMRGMFLFTPQPRLILCLGGDPEVIFARKPETSLIEVERQVRALRKLCSDNPRAVWINTDQSISDAKHNVLKVIQTCLSAH